MKNFLHLHFASAVALAVVSMPFAAVATDWFWYGRGSDTLWTTKENWSTTSNEYTAATTYPSSKTGTYVYINTALAEDHSVTITIPRSLTATDTRCSQICIYDDVAPGSVTIEGEGGDRVNKPTNGRYFWSGTEHPMTLTFRNLVLGSANLNCGYNDCDGNGFCVDNCFLSAEDSSSPFLLPGGEGGKCVVVDSVYTNIYLRRKDDLGALTFAVTNSIISCTAKSTGYFTIGGPGTVVDFYNSTLGFRTASYFGEATLANTNNHPNMSIRFRNCDIYSGPNGENPATLSLYGKDCDATFDNVRETGYLGGVGMVGTTRLIGTSFRFNYCKSGRPYEGGTVYLDNSEWVASNRYTAAMSAPLRFVISGRDALLDPGCWYGNVYPVTLDFIVPKGGYAHPPVNRMDNNSATTLNLFGKAGGAVNVLPESPALKVPGTLIQPLIYLKGTKATCNLANAPLATLPNEKSKFLVTTDYSWEYADVNSKQESDWTEVATGYNQTVAGVAVKIVATRKAFCILLR